MSINITIGDQPTSKGILEEVGDDYIVIKPDDSPDWPLDSMEEYSRMGGHWFVDIKEAMPILHFRGCTKCSAKAVA